MDGYQHQFINGEWKQGTGGRMMTDINPYTGEKLYTYRSAGKQDVDEAFRCAKAAQIEWEKTTPKQKQGYLERLAKAIIEKRDEIYYWLRAEGGSTVAKCDFEYYTSINIVKEAMAFPLMMDGKVVPSNIPDKANYIVRKPKGVIGVITPWNVPLVLSMRSIVPAVATGNAVVVKPASDTPATGFLIAEFFERAGFPRGLVNVVAGSGSEIGDAFVSHPVPKLISFTGSTSVGRRIGETAGMHLKDVSLELGGNNAMIVLKDADIAQAAKSAAFGAFFHQGQVCMALNRVIADKDIYDEFAGLFVETVKGLKAGDPADPDTFIGPVINGSQASNIEQLVEATIKAGANAALKGRTEGNLIHPWIFTEATNDMPAAKNEVFGPVCCVIRAENEEEAVRIANDTEYGLSGSVFTKDIYHGMQVARRFETGMVHVNDQSINDEPHVMFGGEKASGLGRFNAQWVVDKFTTPQWISVQDKDRRYF